jgi:hypothetical protein
MANLIAWLVFLLKVIAANPALSSAVALAVTSLLAGDKLGALKQVVDLITVLLGGGGAVKLAHDVKSNQTALRTFVDK